MGRPPVLVPVRTCQHCGQPIPRSDSEHAANYATRKYCSRPCAFAARKAAAAGFEHRTCEVCGKPILRRSDSPAKYKTRRFCSRSCHLRHRWQADGTSGRWETVGDHVHADIHDAWLHGALLWEVLTRRQVPLHAHVAWAHHNTDPGYVAAVRRAIHYLNGDT